jgi:hypothetical protein
MRVDFNASLRTDLYAFLPGFGPFSALRHKVSPSLTYNYAPEATADSLQRLAFRGSGVQERNILTFSFSQTFEAKYRERPRAGGEAEPAAPADTTATDSLIVPRDTATGPTRRERAMTIRLLSITTDAIAYDFVRAREDDEGITTLQIGNSIQSDLVRGLSLNIRHDLFRQEPTGVEGDTRREFAPHLSSVTANFSLDSNSWLFRVLRLGGGQPDSVPGRQPAAPLQSGDPLAAGPAMDRSTEDRGLIGGGRQGIQGVPAGQVGQWSASFNYSLNRPREELDREGLQTLGIRASFQPTEFWSVSWDTNYSITDGEFANHILRLTRRLHDWDANFDFVKAQNGNFSFSFNVRLRANPDIKLDYSQHDLRAPIR